MSQQDPFSRLPLRKRINQQDDKPVKKLKRGRPPKSTTNNDIYCICKRPYDVPRFMIACDKCNEWFHGECIGISEKQGEFIHLYFCDNCSKITGKQTSWKPNCANPTCTKPAGIESQYCTDDCEQDQQYSLSTKKLVLFADMDDRARLSRVKEERILAKSKLMIIEKKLELLFLLKKHSSVACGFDSRFTWPEHVWNQVDQVNESTEQDKPHLLLNTEGLSITLKPISICQQQAVNCTKHKSWQKLKLSDLEKERSEQFTILLMLERERQQVKLRMKKRREDNDFLD